MTTNHPAHGPVSLDRLHQIREILSKAAAQSDGGNIGYAMADAVKVIDGAIAAFGAEPVGEVVLGEYDDCGRHPDARVVCIAADGQADWENFKDGTLLYAVTPAPVVPEEITSASAPEIFEIAAEAERLGLRGTYASYAVGWNACRAAMLQAGNSPVAPDTWIPASERMPDKLIPVMVMYADGEMWSAIWTGTRWDDGTEFPDPHAVTHWREMPAAPQQEVKSALEHGMQRYAGAMQKLADAGD